MCGRGVGIQKTTFKIKSYQLLSGKGSAHLTLAESLHLYWAVKYNKLIDQMVCVRGKKLKLKHRSISLERRKMCPCACMCVCKAVSKQVCMLVWETDGETCHRKCWGQRDFGRSGSFLAKTGGDGGGQESQRDGGGGEEDFTSGTSTLACGASGGCITAVWRRAVYDCRPSGIYHINWGKQVHFREHSRGRELWNHQRLTTFHKSARCI